MGNNSSSARLREEDIINPSKSGTTHEAHVESAPRTTQCNQSHITHKPTSLKGLPYEIRHEIYLHLLPSPRPYMIGRSQETLTKTNGSPRDITSFSPTPKYEAQRDDTWNRPIQPPITLVCALFRDEALPLWYALNKFWLIHNEFSPENREPQKKGYEIWLEQILPYAFDLMENVSLCGYYYWPSRVMITLDLKARKLIGVRHYSTYGNNLSHYSERWIERTQEVLRRTKREDGTLALLAVVEEHKGLFEIQSEYIGASPGVRDDRMPASGWEYDW